MSEPKTIPKFGSFRRNPVPSIETLPEKDSKTGRERPQKTHSKTNHQSVDHGVIQKDKKVHHRRRRSRSRSRDNNSKREQSRQTRDVKPVESVAIHTPPNEANSFSIDTKGDEKNLVYGSIHRYDVPAFRRVGAGNVMGASNRLKINRYLGEDKFIVLSDWRDSTFGSRERYTFSKLRGDRPKLLKIRYDSVETDRGVLDADFIAFHASRGRSSKISNSDDDLSARDDEPNYRSIHGKKKAGDQPDDVAFQYASDSDDFDEKGAHDIAFTSFYRQKDLELKRRVEQFPGDMDAWLELIELQDRILHGENEQYRATNAEIKSTAEIKISLYEKSLEQAKLMTDRERLLVGFMAEGSKIWESQYQSDRWEEISKRNIDSLNLWKSYLEFKQTTFSTFRYEKIRDIFIARIKLLWKEIKSTDSEDSILLYTQIIYVLLRTTLFIRESGFSELAVAIWQAMLELNFCGPKSETTTEDRKQSFGEFWETELPRIGETNASGWNHYTQHPDDSEAPPGITDAPEIELVDNKLFSSWATAERSRQTTSSLPARTLDDVAEDDPYRVILYSDIEDFLTVFPFDIRLRSSLIDAFLFFCRLPPMAGSNIAGHLRVAEVRGQDLLEYDPRYISRQFFSKNQVIEDKLDIQSPLLTPLINYSMSADTSFSAKHWFIGMPSWQDRFSPVHQPVSYPWVRNVLKQLNTFYPLEEFAEYYAAFEWRNEPATIKKTCKALLKQHSASLRLYNAYAMIEAARGNEEISNGVFSAAISMSKSMPEKQACEAILLWKSWVWTSLEASDNSTALQRILSVPDGLPSNTITNSPTTLLKTSQHLKSNRDYLLSSGDVHHAVLHTELLALFHYLTSSSNQETQSSTQGDISAALSTFTAFSQTLQSRPETSQPHELLFQSASRLLYHHALAGPFRPALLRHHLTNFLTSFPQNTIFLSLYTWNESRLRIENRVRNILQSTVLIPRHDILTSRLFAIHYEIQHGTIHSVRSAFEHAVSSPKCKAEPGLWRLYLLYCLQVTEFRGTAKDVWYRAINICPWAKELYVLGMERFDGIEGFAELKRMWRGMGEKELRVCVDLEEKFEDLKELEEQDDGRKGVRKLGFRQ
jgi:hypothetical protein